MLKVKAVFSGYSVNDLDQSLAFYRDTLGVDAEKNPMGLKLQLPGGGQVFLYPKADHAAASFTVLNLVVDSIDDAVDALSERGVEFIHYAEGQIKTDAKGVARGIAAGMGPDIAWFADPSGNILSVLQEPA